MLRKFLVLVLTGFCIVSFKINATAEESAAASEEEWSPSSAGPISTWTAPLCGKGKFVIQPFLFYNRTRGAFDSDGHYDSLSEGNSKYQLQEQLFMQYGITDKLEIDAQVVYQQNYLKQDDLRAHKYGLGDSYLFLRYCAVEEKKLIPHTVLHFQLKAPTGKYQHLDPDKLGTDSMGATTGGGSWDPGIGLNLTKKFKPFMFHADAVYSFPQKVRVDGAKTIYGKYLNYDFGVEYFLPKGFNLMLELNGLSQGDRWQDSDRVMSSDVKYLVVCPGIGWSCDKLQTLLAYQRTLAGTNTDANDSVILTCVYTF